ncbi:TPA: tetratricopeptide repeat protein, partial [bacterium]|nr:tetratricopeptide repeat protein [bacterium]
MLKFNKTKALYLQAYWVIFAFSVFFLNSYALGQESSIILVGISGSVQVGFSSLDEWEVPEVKQDISRFASIKTGPDSGAVILYSNGYQVKVGADTVLNIQNLGSLKDLAEMEFDLEQGIMWAETNKMLEGGSFRVNTPSAVVAIRGTEFVVEVDKQKAGTLTVIEGEADFGNQYGRVTVKTSQQSTALPGQAPTPPKVVDTRHWIEWTFEIQSMGNAIETPFFPGENKQDLETKAETLKDDLDDDDYSGRLELARLYYDAGKYDAAEVEFEFCTDDDETIWDAMYGLGLVGLAKGDIAGAIEQFEHLIWSVEQFAEQYPDEEADAVQYYLSQAHLGIGLSLLKQNKLEQAELHFDKAISLNSAAPLPYVGLAEIYLRQSKIDDASIQLQKALELNEDTYQALSRFATVQMHKNDKGMALKYANRAVEIAPYSPNVHSVMATIRFFRNEYGEARESAQASVSLDPYNSIAHEVLSRLFITEGKMQDAAKEALVSL